MPERWSTTEPLDARSARLRQWIGLGLIAVVAACVYLPALDGKPLWDDDGHITKPELRGAKGLVRIWGEPGATQQYYPLLHTAFWVEYQLFGDRTAAYHRLTLLMHLGSTLLVYLIVRRLEIPGALLAAALFALHPMQVESVAWITEQKNTLSTLFYLGAMLVYLHFDASRKESQYAWAFLLFVLGLLSKTVTATLPAALLVIFWWQRGRLSWRRDVLPLVPFFALGLAGGIITAYLERKDIGAEGADFSWSIAQRILIAGRVIWFYLGHLAWPADLMFWYPRWTVDPGELWQWLYPAAALAVTIVLWALRGRTRAPLAAWLFFVGTLFPVLGFLNVYPFRFSFVADHFQYLACLGPIALAAAGVARLVTRLPESTRWAGGAAALAWVGALALVARAQSANYSTPVTLYEATLTKNPDCWVAHNNLGHELDDQPTLARQHYEEALRLKPDYAEAHNNLGGVLLTLGQTDAAIKHFVTAIKLRNDTPDFYTNLGNALVAAGRAQEALPILKKVIELVPDLPEGETNLALAFLKLGQPQQALEHAQQSLRLDPTQPEANSILGNALLDLQRPQEATGYLEKAVQLNPKFMEAWANLALAYAVTNRKPQALDAAGKALQLAREAGRTESADQIEHWLNAFRAGQYDAQLQQPFPGTPDPSQP